MEYRIRKNLPGEVIVYCSAHAFPAKSNTYLGAELRYISISANGVASVAYDVLSILDAIRLRCDNILLLGVSGALFLPLARLTTRARIVTNIDGVEWRRAKWGFFARWFLRISEWFAVRFSNVVISDNQGIADYVLDQYGVRTPVIAYGGDHAIGVDTALLPDISLPECFGLMVCRIEPENNVHMLLEAYSRVCGSNLVAVGNWSASSYGNALRRKYASSSNIWMLDPIYDAGILKSLRTNCECYIHGHSAGGTNPSLVEAMHFGIPILAFDCGFNRFTTENLAAYFSDVDGLVGILERDRFGWQSIGRSMQEIASARYTWDEIAARYFELFK